MELWEELMNIAHTHPRRTLLHTATHREFTDCSVNTHGLRVWNALPPNLPGPLHIWKKLRPKSHAAFEDNAKVRI